METLIKDIDSGGPLSISVQQVPACDLCGAPVNWMTADDAFYFAVNDPATADIVRADAGMLADVWTCSRQPEGCTGGATLLNRFMNL